MKTLFAGVAGWLTRGALLLLTLLGVSLPSWAQPPQDRWERLGRVLVAHARHTDALMELPDVVGVGVGFNQEGKPVLKVFAKKARPEGVPARVDGADVEVIHSGSFYALAPAAPAATRGQPLQNPRRTNHQP